MGERHLGINVETCEEIPDTLEKVNKSVIAGTNTHGRLVYVSLGPDRSQKEGYIR
jgi:hypothetical protein